jgi:hypothetical protein
LLPARKLCRKALGERREIDQPQDTPDPLGNFELGNAPQLKPKGDAVQAGWWDTTYAIGGYNRLNAAKRASSLRSPSAEFDLLWSGHLFVAAIAGPRIDHQLL